MDTFIGLEFLAVKLMSMIIFVALQERDSMETVNQLEVVLGEIDAMSTGTTRKICYKLFVQPISPDIIRGSA